MSGKYDTKGCVEILNLVKVISLSVIAAGMEDGWQWSDTLAFLKSPKFEEALKPVLADWALVPLEVMDLDIFDDIALGKEAYGMIQELVAALRPKK